MDKSEEQAKNFEEAALELSVVMDVDYEDAVQYLAKSLEVLDKRVKKQSLDGG